jgi:adenine-specific DNA-methyltransferase
MGRVVVLCGPITHARRDSLMAKIDELLTQINDPQLRQDLVGAVAELRSQKHFGLVFEEHVPETTVLRGFPIKVGLTVVRRDDPALKRPMEVRAVSGSTAVMRNLKGHVEEAPVSDLMVVKPFGDPIFPTLRSVGATARGGAKPYHAVVNGENFHALQALLYLYEGQVDCVYIDPPYNTGAKDWRYNNHYVDSKDRWRHSKWLSFMDKRLRLAKRLLRPDGVLIVTIDEHEVHHLGCLLESLFPTYRRHTVTIIINPKGTGKLNFARVDEYAIFCVPDLGKGVSVITGPPTYSLPQLELDGTDTEDEGDDEDDDINGDDEEEEEEADNVVRLPFPEDEIDQWELRHARRRGNESSYRHQREKSFYPILVDLDAGIVRKALDSIPLGEDPSFDTVDGLTPVWPIDNDGNHRCWRYTTPTMRRLIEEGKVVLGRRTTSGRSWTLNIWVRRPPSKKLKTVWSDKLYDAGTHGTSLLHRILGRRNSFPFPKSVYAVRDSLSAVVRLRPRALIVDFFAGSGTTFHATCLLNAADGGERRCILVTNNEVAAKDERRLAKSEKFRGDPEFESLGIFEQATRPRCEAVVSGKRPDGRSIPGLHADGRALSQGFDENVEFFHLDYLDPDEVALDRQFEAIVPLLWLVAGGRGTRPAISTRGAYTVARDAPFAVLHNEGAFRRFVEELKQRPDVTHVWIVTNSERAFAEMRAAMPRPNLNVSMLYRDYLHNFKVNTEVADLLRRR